MIPAQNMQAKEKQVRIVDEKKEPRYLDAASQTHCSAKILFSLRG